MPSVIKTVTWDCAEALKLARFWAAALAHAGRYDGEVARLEALGAPTVRRDPALTMMRDPEGNEFCVEPTAQLRLSATHWWNVVPVRATLARRARAGPPGCHRRH